MSSRERFIRVMYLLCRTCCLADVMEFSAVMSSTVFFFPTWNDSLVSS